MHVLLGEQAASEFVAYAQSHLAGLLVVAILSIGLVCLGRRIRGGSSERPVRRFLAITLVAINLPLQIRLLLPHAWRLDESLPFELCDLAWMVAVMALWTRSQWAFALTYYWGLTFTLLSLLTPDLSDDFPSPTFLSFFALHGLTVIAALFLTFGLGMRPTWRLLGLSVAITIGWMLAMLAFNAAAGTNYLYLLRKPAHSSPLDYFGAWPWYLFVEMLVGSLVWTAITLPWIVKRQRVNGL